MSQGYVPRRITIAEMAPHVHSFGIGENKANKISNWLKDWIEKSLVSGKVCHLDFLPSKGDLAFHIGVSKGTIQNAFRILEDAGVVESKQKIGTFIKNRKANNILEKLTSKREITSELIKKYILKNGYKKGDKLASTRILAKELNVPVTTIRTAINTMIQAGIISKGKKSFIVENINFEIKKIESKTLVDKIAEKIKKYVTENCHEGDKLPSNNDFAALYGASIKTIHDAIKILTKEGVINTRRGRYGTKVAISSSGNDYYNYEKIEHKIKLYISKECEIGSKLPSMRVLSEKFNVSTKTIKKALDNLSEDGYVTFARGRNGGTYITDIPQGANDAYTWLALNPEYVQDTEN